MPLTGRRLDILRIIVEDYIGAATPIASKAIADKYGLKASPATIRNDMAYLEQEGYVTRPHISAGSVPTDKAYHYYVDSINEDVALSQAEQRIICQLLQEAKEEIEQWLRLAAAVLARFVRNTAMVTLPIAGQCRFKHLDLVALHDFMALLILVLYGARIKQQVLSFDRQVSQDELTRSANKISRMYAGMTHSEILAMKPELSIEEKRMSECSIGMMAAEDRLKYGKAYLEGLHFMLSQPEFARSPRIPDILQVLDKEDWLGNIPCPGPSVMTVRVIIGEENPEEGLRDLSLAISSYGVPGKVSGMVGVLGPKRMDYVRTISLLNYFAKLLSSTVGEYV